MSDHADNLTPKQHKTIAALLASPTIAAAASAVGMAERQIYRWLEDPVFSEAYRAARRDAVAHATARLQQISGEAVDTLAALLTCSAPTVRLAAASKILDLAMKHGELEDLAVRLAALEAAYAARSERRNI